MAWYIAYMTWTILDKKLAKKLGYERYGTARRVSGKNMKDAERNARKKYSSKGTKLSIRMRAYDNPM